MGAETDALNVTNKLFHTRMNITRRDILKLIGGTAAGFFFTPMPWKLLDDTSIWTQNWSLIPPLPHGPISTKYSSCTLCGAGCAVKAKCVNDIPYLLTGIPNHPIDNGSLCPRGIAGHHLANHPLRVVAPQKFLRKSLDGAMTPISFEEAVKEIAERIQKSNGSVALFDSQPRRAISETYREFFTKLPEGICVAHPSKEEATLLALSEMVDKNNVTFGYDFENTQLVLSFCAPLLDNWGIPGRMSKIFGKRKETGLKLIQIESNHSRTALQSDIWLPIKPGTEYFAALAIINVLIKEIGTIHHSNNDTHQCTDYNKIKQAALQFSAAEYSEITGIDFALFRQAAKELAQAKSAIVLSGPDPGGGPFDNETEKIIASMNILIGSVGKKGGIVVRGVEKEDNILVNKKLNEVPDSSIEVLFVDSADSGYALPWKFIEKKLMPQHTIVSLSPFLNELVAHADYIIPAPAPYESLQDIPSHGTSAINSFSISAPLFPKKECGIEPRDLLKSIANFIGLQIEIPTEEEAIKRQTEKIFSAKRGSVFSFADETTKSVTEFSSSNDIYNKLLNGAVWIDEPKNIQRDFHFTLNISTKKKIHESNGSLVLIPQGWKPALSSASISPILSKVFQESGLQNNAGTVSLNPETAKHFGLKNDDTATLETEKGKVNVRVKVTNAVQQGIILAAVGPAMNGTKFTDEAHNDILSLCTISDNGTWKITQATISKM